METGTIGSVLEITGRLKAAKIFYRLSDHTETAIMIEVAVPGERWEIECHENGNVGIEVFSSTGNIQGRDALNSLFERFTD